MPATVMESISRLREVAGLALPFTVLFVHYRIEPGTTGPPVDASRRVHGYNTNLEVLVGPIRGRQTWHGS